MAYKDEVNWTQLMQKIENATTRVIESLKEGEERYQKFVNMKGAATNAQIATKLGKSEADINALEATYNAMHQVYLFATNQVATTGDHIQNMRDFSA